MEEKKKKMVNTNLGILLICLFSSVFTLADFLVVDHILGKYFDYSKCNCPKCVDSNLNLDGVIDNKKDDDIIEDDGVVIEDQQIKDRIQSIMEEYFNNIFDLHSTQFCGDLNYDDVYGSYVNVIRYNSIESLKNDYKTYLSEEYIDKYIIGFFEERDNKLYCRPRRSVPYTYEAGSFEVVSMKKNDKGITATGFYSTEENTGLYPAYTFDVSLDLIYNDDDILVLNNMDDKMRNS